MGEYIKVAKVGDIPSGEMLGIDVGERRIVVANVEGEFYAFDTECTHQGGPLDEGFLEGNNVQCPWHFGEFNVKSGEVESPPPGEPIAVYKVRVQGEDLEVEQPS